MKLSVEMLHTSEWTLLSDKMNQARYSFTPARYQSRAYLCVAGQSNIDVFNLVTFGFLPPLLVPLIDIFTSTVCVVSGDELTIISASITTVVNLQTLATREVKHKERKLRPACTPVECAGWVYWIDCKGKCVRARDAQLEEF